MSTVQTVKKKEGCGCPHMAVAAAKSSTLKARLRLLKLRARLLSGGWKDGKFEPDEGDTPDKDGFYWRTINGRKIRFKPGDDFKQNIIDQVGYDITKPRSEREKNKDTKPKPKEQKKTEEKVEYDPKGYWKDSLAAGKLSKDDLEKKRAELKKIEPRLKEMSIDRLKQAGIEPPTGATFDNMSSLEIAALSENNWKKLNEAGLSESYGSALKRLMEQIDASEPDAIRKATLSHLESQLEHSKKAEKFSDRRSKVLANVKGELADIKKTMFKKTNARKREEAFDRRTALSYMEDALPALGPELSNDVKAVIGYAEKYSEERNKMEEQIKKLPTKERWAKRKEFSPNIDLPYKLTKEQKDELNDLSQSLSRAFDDASTKQSSRDARHLLKSTLMSAQPRSREQVKASYLTQRMKNAPRITMGSTISQAHADQLSGLWNALPDKVRNEIDSIAISRIPDVSGCGGSWSTATGNMNINMSNGVGRSRLRNVFMHETAHSAWDRLPVTDRELFKQLIDKIGPLSAYSAQYETLAKARKSSNPKIGRIRKAHGKEIYYNECHSELVASMYDLTYKGFHNKYDSDEFTDDHRAALVLARRKYKEIFGDMWGARSHVAVLKAMMAALQNQILTADGAPEGIAPLKEVPLLVNHNGHRGFISVSDCVYQKIASLNRPMTDADIARAKKECADAEMRRVTGSPDAKVSEYQHEASIKPRPPITMSWTDYPQYTSTHEEAELDALIVDRAIEYAFKMQSDNIRPPSAYVDYDDMTPDEVLRHAVDSYNTGSWDRELAKNLLDVRAGKMTIQEAKRIATQSINGWGGDTNGEYPWLEDPNRDDSGNAMFVGCGCTKGLEKSILAAKIRMLKLRARILSGGWKDGKFEPDEGDEPDKDGFYWRTINGRKIRFKPGDDFKQNIIDQVGFDITKPRSEREKDKGGEKKSKPKEQEKKKEPEKKPEEKPKKKELPAHIDKKMYDLLDSKDVEDYDDLKEAFGYSPSLSHDDFKDPGFMSTDPGPKRQAALKETQEAFNILLDGDIEGFDRAWDALIAKRTKEIGNVEYNWRPDHQLEDNKKLADAYNHRMEQKMADPKAMMYRYTMLDEITDIIMNKGGKLTVPKKAKYNKNSKSFTLNNNHKFNSYAARIELPVKKVKDVKIMRATGYPRAGKSAKDGQFVRPHDLAQEEVRVKKDTVLPPGTTIMISKLWASDDYMPDGVKFSDLVKEAKKLKIKLVVGKWKDRQVAIF